jgi:uncharacterized protein (DUF1684 family)
MEASQWETNLERARASKDSFFAQHWQSPILPQDKPRFKGLEYYPSDPSYRFELELHEHPEKQAVRMAYTKGNEQDFLRWGEFRFKIGGRSKPFGFTRTPLKKRCCLYPLRMRPPVKKSMGLVAIWILS